MRSKLILKISLVPILAVALLTLMAATNCSNTTQNAAVAVNKYANSLSAFQDAEIKMHDSGQVDNDTHRAILQAEVVAADAGKSLDAAIVTAARGGDSSALIKVAEQGLQDLVTKTNLVKNDQTRQNLVLLLTGAGDTLQNAVSLIKAIKPAKSSPAGFWFMLPLFGIAVAAGSGQLTKVANLILLIEQLEPIAFDLVVKLAEDLKGKTPEEIAAMSDALFDKVNKTAAAELDKLDQGQDSTL